LRQVLPFLAFVTAAFGADPVRVGIFLKAPESAEPDVLAAVRIEVDRLLSRPGTELVWRDQISGSETFHRVVVVRLRGACSAGSSSRPPRPSTLGSTHVTNGKVQPFIDISCEQVTAAISRRWDWPGGRISPELLGRALARVAAHEIFHALTESVHHDDEGLMKPSFDRLDLCSRRLDLIPASLARLDRALGLAGRPVSD
jgi:hypothetical protein